MAQVTGAPTRVAINGFGRMGRLALRAGWGRDDMRFVHVNEVAGDAATAAHLLEFDSVHGRWDHDINADVDRLTVDGHTLSYSDRLTPGAVDWERHGAEIVLECSGRFRTMVLLQPYLDAGVKKVIVAAPVKDDRALNVVLGVTRIVTTRSATTWSPLRPARRTAWRRWSGSCTRGSGSGAGPSRRCTT